MPLVDVDHVDPVGAPAERDGPAAQVGLAGGRLGVAGDLAEGGLADAEVGVAAKPGRGHLAGGVGAGGHGSSAFWSGVSGWCCPAVRAWASVIWASTAMIWAVAAGRNDEQAGVEPASPPWVPGADGDGVAADRDASACGVVPAVAPRSGGVASRAAHAAIPFAASTPSPCRHPPLPPADAARSCSYRPIDCAGAAAPAACSAALGPLLTGLSGPGGAAAAQRAFCRARGHADPPPLLQFGSQGGRAPRGIGGQAVLP